MREQLVASSPTKGSYSVRDDVPRRISRASLLDSQSPWHSLGSFLETMMMLSEGSISGYVARKVIFESDQSVVILESTLD